MKFSNRPNECVTLDDGREIWIARHIAVAVSAIALVQNTPFILVNQRGTGVPNFQGYWNLPCGYLDYDETTQEAAVREVWEECGVNIVPLLEASHIAFFEQPWDVHSRPGGAKQNVTIHHGFVVTVNALPEVSAVNNEPNETMDIRWLPLAEVAELEFAFDHKPRISQFVKHVSELSPINLVDHLGTDI